MKRIIQTLLAAALALSALPAAQAAAEDRLTEGTLSQFFPDANLAQQVLKALPAEQRPTSIADGTVTAAQLAALTSLNASYCCEGADFECYCDEPLQVEDLTGLNYLTGLTSLTLDNDDLGALPADAFAGLTSLTYLSMSSAGVTQIPAGLFASTNSLRQLNLQGNAVTTLPADLFGPVTGLTHLSLADNSINAIAASGIAKLTSLSVLDLSGNYLPNASLTPISKLTGLTKLYLAGNNVKTLSYHEPFLQLAKLTVLDLSNNPLKTVPDGAFDALTNLRELYLGSDVIVDDANLDTLTSLAKADFISAYHLPAKSVAMAQKTTLQPNLAPYAGRLRIKSSTTNAGLHIEFTSSKPSLVGVDSATGKLKAKATKKKATATITLTVGDCDLTTPSRRAQFLAPDAICHDVSKKSYTVTVTPKAVKAKKLKVSGPSKLAVRGFDWLVVDAGSASNAAPVFKSTNPAVLTVDKYGKVTAVKAGTAKVKVSAAGKTAVKKITVS
ncbi:MAG: leucine-rich repeat domain-containing protein [Propionibacteriaceae bacterium]|nr:leucine-rich repeat domain-containing protein [Propionibacteriaceae bacterium]